MAKDKVQFSEFGRDTGRRGKSSPAGDLTITVPSVFWITCLPSQVSLQRSSASAHPQLVRAPHLRPPGRRSRVPALGTPVRAMQQQLPFSLLLAREPVYQG